MIFRLPQYSLTTVQGSLNVDKALVGGTAEQQVGVAERLDERPVDEDVDLCQEFALVVVDKTFKRKARIAPDVLLRAAVYLARQFWTVMVRPPPKSHDCGLWQPGQAWRQPAQ